MGLSGNPTGATIVECPADKRTHEGPSKNHHKEGVKGMKRAIKAIVILIAGLVIMGASGIDPSGCDPQGDGYGVCSPGSGCSTMQDFLK